MMDLLRHSSLAECVFTRKLPGCFGRCSNVYILFTYHKFKIQPWHGPVSQ